MNDERKARKAAYLEAVRIYLGSQPGRAETAARRAVESAWLAWQEVNDAS